MSDTPDPAVGFRFTEEEESQIREIVGRYPQRQAALLPVLRLAQDRSGYVSPDVVEEVARALELPPAHVAGVASFYTLYYKERVGRHLIQVCRNLSCALMGGFELIAYAEKKLGVKEGQTTEDGRFSLFAVECIAACDGAPCLQVNDDYYLNVTPERFDEILADLS